MYISKLHLRAFGKFLSKKLPLDKNFNIIYGENEAGKSTIHNFIEAMLYGFDEDEIARYNKYRPWNSNIYKGSMEVRDVAGDKYDIAKDFLLGTTQVFKKQENDTEMLINDITSPGDHFLNMNKSSFINTISVRQLGNKTEKELATELKSKIINLSNTRDETISIDRILQRLNGIKDEVGDEDNDKTLLGQYSLRLSQLEAARENSVNANRQVMFLLMEKKKIGSKILELNLKIEELKKELYEYELSIKKDKFLRAEPVKEELDEINKKLSEFKEENLKKYSESDYREAIKTEESIKSMCTMVRNLENERNEKEEELEKLLTDISNKIEELFDIEKLNGDYKKYESNNEKIKELKTKIQSGKESIASINLEELNKFIEKYNEIEDINKKIEITNVFLQSENYEKMKNYKSKQVKNVVLLSVLGVIFIVGTWLPSIMYKEVIEEYINLYYVIQNSSLIAAGILTILISIIVSLIIRPALNKIKNSKNEIDSMECEFADYSISLEKLNQERTISINEAGCEEYSELLEMFKKISSEKNLYEEKTKLINYDLETLKALEQENSKLKDNLLKLLDVLELNEINPVNIQIANDAYLRKDTIKKEATILNEKIKQLTQSILKLNKETAFEEKRLSMIFNSNGMGNLEEFRKAVEYNERYEELINNKNYKSSILHKIIGDESFEDLRNIVKKASHIYEIKKIDKQEHQLKIFKFNDEKIKLSESIDEIFKEIDEIENNTRSLAEVEEEIDFYENKINSFKRKINIANIAGDKISKISDSIKGDFMPLLRKSISDNFAYLTGGKYCEVVIDEDMNITVIEEDNKERNVELESLSGGTLDQLYVALRVGLGNILSGNRNIPLIFDDSFVQYDSKRLRNSIEMLAKESERRQIILFTCQEREAEVASQINVEFNHIKL